MSLKPLRDWIVVSVTKEPETSPGGLIIRPATALEEKNVTGMVIAVGSGHLTNTEAIVPLEVSKGDHVLFNRQMAVEIKHGGEAVYLVREEHVLSIVAAK
jgi:chaperonin GroES